MHTVRESRTRWTAILASRVVTAFDMQKSINQSTKTKLGKDSLCSVTPATCVSLRETF